MRTTPEVTDELFVRMTEHFSERLVEITALLTVVFSPGAEPQLRPLDQQPVLDERRRGVPTKPDRPCRRARSSQGCLGYCTTISPAMVLPWMPQK